MASVTAKGELTRELHRSGIALMRANLARKFPAESAEQIQSRLVAWMRERPGAPFGDADGVPSKRFG